MNFERAIGTINGLLHEHQPSTFNSSWICTHAPAAYRFFRLHVRADSGGIDWDRITRAIDRRFQKRWVLPCRGRRAAYRDDAESAVITGKYQDKLYTFLTPGDRTHNEVRDTIIISLVRIAQRGNVTAAQRAAELLSFTVDQWIEENPRIFRWRGYGELIQKHIERCIRAYRYSGSFMGYLFRTLEYAGRGLTPIESCSLDDTVHFSGRRRMDMIGRDPETNDLLVRGFTPRPSLLSL